ncbi:MAG: Na/Pi cotransporter family protein [Bdellovibrionaceae bacterium]|nr:Na/Pi cotransporter family protein [Pseudobdellovibrionaceae bacterium]MDW8189944.1 Na/Pi cotransporter family protein [Pseudobdellovibrionaceae bacterium]
MKFFSKFGLTQFLNDSHTKRMVDFGVSPVVLILGGIAIFMFGMNMASESLQKLFAQRLQWLFQSLEKRNVLSVLVGIGITTILQSSGAVTTMLVGLGTARVISLRNVMGVILGTSIGSTVTVQIISLNLGQYSLPSLFIAFMIWLMAKRPGLRHFMSAVMGFGFLFLGLSFLSAGARGFAQDPFLKQMVTQFADSPVSNFIVATLFCAFVHSSAVTVGLAMSLVEAGLLDFHHALFWVYGANVGTTSTALLAASGSNFIGKQIAWAHFFYKFFSALIFMLPPLHELLVWVVSLMTENAFRGVALSHLCFNLISAGFFYSFINQGAKIIEKLFPPDPRESFGAEFLKLNYYSNPALAVAYAQREILRVADIVISMIRDSIVLFQSYDSTLLESIRERDKQVDFLFREIKHFLLEHANQNPTGVEKNIMDLIIFLTDLERAADAIDINLTQLATKKFNLKLNFSEEGAREIQMMHEQCLKTASLAVNAFTEKSLCPKVIEEKRLLSKMEKELREHHIERLHRGLTDSIKTSNIHIDALSEYRRIGSLLSGHCYSYLNARYGDNGLNSGVKSGVGHQA